MRPESRPEKKARLDKEAEAIASGKSAAEARKSDKKPVFVKSGLNHVTALIESKKAALVAIANDGPSAFLREPTDPRAVDPIELVVFLPALCRKMGVPYVVVSNKARLGAVVGRKTAAVIVRQTPARCL